MDGPYAIVDLWGTLEAINPSALASRQGLTQNEAVTLATLLTIAHDVCQWGHAVTTVAWYRPDGKLAQFTSPTTERRFAELSEKYEPIPVFGSAPYGHAYPGGDGVPDNWGKLIALASQKVTREIAALKHGGEVPKEHPEELLQENPVAIAAVIVAGVAVTVVGTAAVWRYFDTDTRQHTVEVASAASDYAQRIGTFERTGKMPPASETEKAVAQSIEERAEAQSTYGTLVSGGVGAAVGAGVALAAVFGAQRIRRRRS